MPYIKVNPDTLASVGSALQRTARRVSDIESDFSRTARKLDWEIRDEGNLNRRIDNISQALEDESKLLDRMYAFVQSAMRDYASLENPEPTFWEKFKKEFADNFSWGSVLAGGNYIKKIYDFVQSFHDISSWKDAKDFVTGVRDFYHEAAKTYNNYKKIGNIHGTRKAMAYWAKNITGMKPLGRASTAKNPFLRFKGNLTNKTSYFGSRLRETVGDFAGKNGVGKAVASWAGVALEGITNWFSNKEEQAQSNGQMSDARVAAETVTETIVGTLLSHGTSIVVGAALTTLLPVAAPGILVLGLTSVVTLGINAGVKAATGKSTTEWISDSILDGGIAAGKAIGKGATKVKDAIGSWFRKPAYA